MTCTPSAAASCPISSGPPGTAILRRECARIAPQAYYDVETVNAYNIAVDAPLPPDHPGRTTFERGNAFVARDHIPRDAIISQLYTSEVFQRFVAGCFELPRLHELADPLSGLVLNVIPPGRRTPGTSTPTSSPSAC